MIGNAHLIKVVEFDEDKSWMYLPKKDICATQSMKCHIDLKEFFNKMKDP